MTNFDPTDDELVSAYLDGEGTTEEATVVASRPDLVARAEDFRSVQQALGAPIPASSAEPSMDDMIGAALADFGQDTDNDAEVHEFPGDRRHAGGTVDAAAGPVAAAATSPQRSGVADLHAARERRNRRNRWLLSAAAVVLAAVTIPAAISGLTSGGEDSSSSADMALETASVDDAASDDAGDSAGASASSSGEAAGGLDRESSDSADAATGSDDDEGAIEASDTKAAFADEAEEDGDDAMSDADEEPALSADGAAPATTSVATATDAASADPAEEAMLEEERARGTAGSTGPDSLFFIAADLDELVVSLGEPGVLEELAAVADEFGAPSVECAGPGEKGGLARLDDSGMIVEIILAAPDQEPVTRIVDQQTCAVVTTVDP